MAFYLESKRAEFAKNVNRVRLFKVVAAIGIAAASNYLSLIQLVGVGLGAIVYTLNEIYEEVLYNNLMTEKHIGLHDELGRFD